MTSASDSAAFVPLPLEAFLNLAATADRQNPGQGKLDGQFGFAAEALPPPGPARIQEVDWLLPDRASGQADCLVPEGQVLKAPEGEFQALLILGTSVMGSSGMELGLEFTDGTRAVEILRFTDWCHGPQFQEIEALAADYRYSEAGREPIRNWLWLQVFFLPPEKRLLSLRLGPSPNLRIMAVSLGRDLYPLSAPALIDYLLSRLAAKNPLACRYRALFDSLKDMAALRDDDTLRTALEQSRDAVLKRIGVPDLFDYVENKITGVFQAAYPALEALRNEAAATLSSEAKKGPLSITLVGHSHLDAVWLWPWNVTVEKTFRTFSRNLERLKAYPGVTFAQSCPLFYAWMEDKYPEVFEGVKKAVAQGRWELVGGMWVEPDGNLPTGEAMVRQRLFGQRYYLEKFGKLSEVAWIPDTFGMHANHPQIIRKTGGRYFFTTKLTWNYENVFPFNHFIWEAPDGSRVLALQNPIGCGAEPGPHPWLEETVKKQNVLLKPGEEAAVSSAQPELPAEKLSKETVPRVLAIYGEGDGGEGPSEPMFQRADTLALLPDYVNGTVHEHFRTVEKEYGDRLPIWKDELYLENHRGTFTSQERIKSLNRQGEAALLSAERWASLASLVTGNPGARERLNPAWKKLLFNQFHDILPGTSVAQAYVDAELDFSELFRSTEAVQAEALTALAGRIDTWLRKDPQRVPTGRALLLFNALAWDRQETVEIPWGFPGVKVFDRDNHELPSQVIFRDGQNRLLFHVRVPALGYTQVRLLAGKKPSPDFAELKIDGLVAENRFYRLRLNEAGHLVEIHDKALGRNLLDGEANEVRFFKNQPREWNNWNINPEYEKHELPAKGPARIEIVDAGPVTAAFRIFRPVPGNQEMVQEIRLYRDDKRIDFRVDLPVRYTESLVKVVFPFDLGAEFVTTEIGYGTYRRPCRPTTSFEKAKWEVWTQKWLDLSGPSHGVTLMNRSTHGFDIKGDTLRLTLVKGGIMPDPFTDCFSHRIDYSLVSHEGNFEEAHAWRRGFEYNFPVQGRLEACHPGSLPASASLGSVSPEHVCWEVFKQAEEGDGYVLRVYEVEGREAPEVKLTLPSTVQRAEEIDFLELEAIREVEVRGQTLVFPLGHHEIKAIRIYPQSTEAAPC